MIKSLAVLLLPAVISTLYIPQILLASSAEFLNYAMSQNGAVIQKTIDNVSISDISFNDEVQGVSVQFNLTEIQQKSSINWTGNILSVTDQHAFSVQSKNINVTLNGMLSLKAAGILTQKGNLTINITKLETDTCLRILQPTCKVANQGIGFNIQIDQIFIDPSSLQVNIAHKSLSNYVVRLLIKLLKNRIPSLINQFALTTINPLITVYTCQGIQETLNIGSNRYVFTVNTTNLPQFRNTDIYFPVDITFQNQQSNATNDQVHNNNLPFKNSYEGVANATAILSSNMMNAILWLIDDSNALSLNITNESLGPDPPIELNTKALSILIPALRTKWPEREVILLIEPSNKFSHLYIRNGKIVSVLSLSIRFVVNEAKRDDEDAKQCIQAGHCVVACNLNVTLSVSAAVGISDENTLKGLLHSLAIAQISLIDTIVDIHLENLQNILSVIIGSFRPQINKQLQDGILLNTTIFDDYGISSIFMNSYQDYAAAGFLFQ